MNAVNSSGAQHKSAFFTLSLLIDGELVNSLLRDCWPSGKQTVWDQQLLQQVQDKYAESSKLHAAINPMFDDIADRARNLFLHDFLLDTPNDPRSPAAADDPQGEEAALLRNVCARLTLRLPHGIHWRTEGRNTECIDLGPLPIQFDNVLCRGFWMAHSNEALSYHLSFEVPYQAGLAQYFGLSMLQKAFFNTEHTEWLLDDAASGWQAGPPHGAAKPLLAVVEQLFEHHVQHLLKAVGQIDRGNDQVPASVGVRAWQRLVLRHDPFIARTGTSAEAWAGVARHRRLLVVLRDPAFFDTLEQARNEGNSLLGYEPFSPSGQSAAGHALYQLEVLTRQIETQVKARTSADPGLTAEQYTIALFLSGFLQNIVDFLQQDGLEVHDGLMPIYPPAGESGANEGFMLYATPSVVYEVVRTSRSLDGAGRQWIGTCPYVFLVHMTAFHNESLVLAYENNVSRLVGHLQAQGLKSDQDAASDRFDSILDHAFECIRDFRLVTFEQVHKHYSFNVFRYETEQHFFKSIEEVRGVVPRREYWDKVLQHLTETVDGLKQDRGARFERRVAGFGLLLTASSLIQIWLTFFPPVGVPQLSLSINLLALLILAAVLFFAFRRYVPPKRGDRKADSWRHHGAAAAPRLPPVTPSRRTETPAA